MSNPILINWPAVNLNGICLNQTLAAAGNLIINGTMVTPMSQNPYVVFTGLERTVSISSTGNLSGVNFTVTGIYRGNTISEVIAGPNNSTVYTVGFFTTITAVSANAAVATNVRVGSGTTGHTIWVRSDYNRAVNSATVLIDVTANNITYTFETCLYDPFSLVTPLIFSPIDGVTIPTIPAATSMLNATVSISANFIWPTHSSRVRVSTSNTTGSLNFYFLQQGIT